MTPRPIMPAKISAKHCDSIQRARASICAVLPWNRVASDKVSRGSWLEQAGAGGSVPTVPTDEKCPIVNRLESKGFRRSWDAGTLGTRISSHEACACTHEGRRAGERAGMHTRAPASVPTVPTSQILSYYRDINRLTMGRFFSVGTVGTLAPISVRPASASANKILPEIQRDGATG